MSARVIPITSAKRARRAALARAQHHDLCAGCGCPLDPRERHAFDPTAKVARHLTCWLLSIGASQ